MATTRWKLLDERLDYVARTRWEVLAVRSAAGVIAALLSAEPFGPTFAAVWFVCFALTEGGARLASRPALKGGSLTPPRRIAYLVLMALGCLTWCALAVRGWASGEEPLRVAALAVLVTVLFHALGFSSRAPAAWLVMCAPAAALWLALPLFFGNYQGSSFWIANFGILVALIYVLAAAWAMAQNARDLAEAKRRAKEANEAKSVFLGMVSHEIRTPMNGVLGMARALQATSLTPQQRQYVDTILRSGDSLLEILNDVLDHSKIEAGRMDLEIAPFNLREVGRQSVELWTEAAAEKGLELDYDVDPQLPAHVLGDETRVRQIIQNLLSNAVKFTEDGKVSLALRREHRADGEGGIEIAVGDTGPGMDADQVSRLFRPYTQAEASITRKYGGTGLGLSICRTLATMMGGEISVDSTPGKGSTFRVRLPLPTAEATPAPVEAQLEPRLNSSASLHPLRILVTDDNPINLAVARALLGSAGASVETAAHGAEALERVQTDLFDLVLMDVYMPGMDGIEVVGRIRAGLAGPQDIPVIALTAHAGPGEEERLQSLGFNALHTKPIRPADLVATIKRVMESRGRKLDVA